MNFGFFAALIRIARVAMAVACGSEGPKGPPPFMLLRERHSELGKQRLGPVVPSRRRDDRDVQALRLVRLGIVDLREDEVIPDPEGVISPAVERLGGDAPEVAHAG